MSSEHAGERRPLCRDEWCVRHHEVVPGQTTCTNQYGGTFTTRVLSTNGGSDVRSEEEA